MEKFLFYGLPEGIASNAQLVHWRKMNTVPKTTPLAQGFLLLNYCFYFIYNPKKCWLLWFNIL